MTGLTLKVKAQILELWLVDQDDREIYLSSDTKYLKIGKIHNNELAASFGNSVKDTTL